MQLVGESPEVINCFRPTPPPAPIQNHKLKNDQRLLYIYYVVQLPAVTDISFSHPRYHWQQNKYNSSWPLWVAAAVR